MRMLFLHENTSYSIHYYKLTKDKELLAGLSGSVGCTSGSATLFLGD